MLLLSPCDKWVPVTTAWRVLRLRMKERPPVGFSRHLFLSFSADARAYHATMGTARTPVSMVASTKCLSFAAILTLDFTNRVSNSRKRASQNNALLRGPLRHAHWSLFCPRRGLQPRHETRWCMPFLVIASRVCR